MAWEQRGRGVGRLGLSSLCRSSHSQQRDSWLLAVPHLGNGVWETSGSLKDNVYQASTVGPLVPGNTFQDPSGCLELDSARVCGYCLFLYTHTYL